PKTSHALTFKLEHSNGADQAKLNAGCLKALVNFAATGFKARWGSARGMRANVETAARLFHMAAHQLGPQSKRYMGFDVDALEAHAKALRDRPLPDHPEVPGALRFELLLRPE
ncbi:MAG: hypothetical protein VCD31_14655, partial [Alphaproteobacteria bacterium]